MKRYLTLALCLLALPVAAEMYKWTDEKGKVHYSDQPPPAGTKQAETIKVPKAAVAPPPPADAGAAKPATAGAKTTSELEMEFRKRRLEAAEADAKAQKDAEATADKKRQCDRATAQVAALQAGSRITKAGPNGEQNYLNEQEIATEMVEAKKAVASWCK